jgi:hypothetical protein
MQFLPREYKLFARCYTLCEHETENRKTDEMKVYDRQYRLRNMDKLRESKRQYRIKNKDKMQGYYDQYKDSLKEYHRQYQIRNRNKVNESNREYYFRNGDKRREESRQYNFRNKDMRKERQFYSRSHQNPDSYLPRRIEVKSWKTPELVREYFESIAKQLHVTDYTDWYRISRPLIDNLGGMPFDRLQICANF